MAKTPPTPDGARRGAVEDRSQTDNPHTYCGVQRDVDSGKFMDQKSDRAPFTGLRKER